jgi:hypothetical protein
MRTLMFALLILSGVGCGCSRSGPVEPASTPGPLRVVTIPVHGADAEALVDLAHARAGRAFDILAARGACYMPFGNDEVLHFDTPTSDVRSEPKRTTNAYLAEWIRTEPNQEDYDFLGVDVAAAPDARSILITSKFGDAGGVGRVADWIRHKLESPH